MIDIHDGASVRNLERIQENGPGAPSGGSMGRGTTFALVVVSGACVFFAALAFGARKSATPPQSKKTDPLGELGTKQTSPTVLPGEVTFPGILSDKPDPATALAAAGPAPTTTVALPPPPAGDKLPVVPLPARHTVTGVSTAVSKAKDKLSALADNAVDPVSVGGKLASPGSEGGWQVQVSSYKTDAEAQAFAEQLRARGHRAHVQQAEIPKRGTWYRVKIGPFATQMEATKYLKSFAAKEKLPGFVIKSGTDPH
jgi:cell division septation protein DedD